VEMKGKNMTEPEDAPVPNFIRDFIKEDLAANRYARVVTRFPPEPNGYLHIGHAKAMCIDFGMAQEFGGTCNLRFDDTNPVKEDVEYVDSIQADIKWLGFDWEGRLFYASDYFEQIFQYAVQLIKKGKAYVDDQSADEMSRLRGTLTQPGQESPCRNRTVEENLDLFERMRAGEFADGSRVLRAKIDMAAPNMNLRDPVMYRILHEPPHHRTGKKWCIYPMYDFAHGQSDSIEGITHSLCSLEYEDHRPLYNWFLDELGIYHPRQIEFARMNLSYTVLSKRKLIQLVSEKYVDGWDDPRMPTLAGLRRRGVTSGSIRKFVEMIGVSKADSTVDLEKLEYCVREDLNLTASRVMAVLNPLKLVIDNYPDGQIEQLEAQNNPEDANAGTRTVPFSKVIYIEQDDFKEVPPKKYFRLFPGQEVRLKHAYYVKCTGVIKDDSGNVSEVHCTYDPASKGGWSSDGRNVKGTLHWVSAAHAVPAEVRLYDRLFTKPNPDDAPEGADFKANLNPGSKQVLAGCLVEPGLKNAKPGERFQFLRQGYFCVDPDSSPDKPVFNRTVTLKDSWGKIEKKQEAK
jgi:glutaminyl-tRNA synthetase